MALQRAGDQTGGLLCGVQRIQGEHPAGQGELSEQGAVPRPRRACRGPGSGRGPRRWRGRSRRPGRPAPASVRAPVRALPSRAAAGSSPSGAGCSAARWAARRCSRSAGPGVGGISGAGTVPRARSATCPAGRPVPGVGVQIREQAPEGLLAGYEVPAGQRVGTGRRCGPGSPAGRGPPTARSPPSSRHRPPASRTRSAPVSPPARAVGHASPAGPELAAAC